MPKQRRKCGETCTKFACPESTGPVQGVLRPCTLKPMQCPKGATQQTRPRSTTPVLAAGPKQHVPGGFSSSTPPQGGTPSGNLREEAPQGRHGRPAPTDVANPPADEFNGIPSLISRDYFPKCCACSTALVVVNCAFTCYRCVKAYFLTLPIDREVAATGHSKGAILCPNCAFKRRVDGRNAPGIADVAM
jgi:hypothetical protein